jgi:hypothetical protein
MPAWTSTHLDDWTAARAGYVPRIAAFGDAELVDLERWRQAELAKLMTARHPPHATLEELVKLTRWKMKRGVWRARNLQLVKGNEADRVATVTGNALAAVPDVRKPIAIIAELEGVGPATASALMAVVRPDLYPFFDEVVAKQIPGLEKVAFTIPFYVKYAAALRMQAARLGAGWTADGVAEALFATAPADG